MIPSNGVPRFEASHFSGITPNMADAFDTDGVLVLENLIPAEECDRLRARMQEIIEGFDVEEHRTVFSTTSKAHAQEEYFLESGHKTRFFFEEEAFDDQGGAE